MTEFEVQAKVEKLMEMHIRGARRFLITQLEKSMIEAEGDDMKLAISLKIEEAEQKELRLVYIRQLPVKKIPSTPVNIRDTNLVLKNIQDNDKYRNFCNNIAKRYGCKYDFSDTPFGTIPKKNRVYEAIKNMYDDGKFTQDDLNKCVENAENGEH